MTSPLHEDKESLSAHTEQSRVLCVSATTQPDGTHRKLKNRHLQLIGIGGSIGTLLFVQIGSLLSKGGPGSLFLAVVLWSPVVFIVTNCLSEMVTWIPISSPFIRFADHFVDPALGFCAGVNFFLCQAFAIPFEIVAFNLVLNFWTERIPVAVVVVVILTSYALINAFAVNCYGETEFWLALGKLILICGLIIFTFITIIGGNPQHDAYGFRNWNPSRVPGAPFAEYIKTNSLGRFLGFLACFIQASALINGPEYVSMTAGEVVAPRLALPRAFRGVFLRLCIFYLLGSLCVGLVLPYSDTDLRNAISSGHASAGASPYVIAMHHMGIPILPHIVNVFILTSVYSAGNSFVYMSSRTLLGLALEGKVPRWLARCTKTGVPIYCVGIVLTISCIAFIQVSNNGAVVLQWLQEILIVSILLNQSVILFTYIRFSKALKLQSIPRETLPYRAIGQPFSAYLALGATTVMSIISGYSVFLPGRWNTTTFVFSYSMLGVFIASFAWWKITRRSKWQKLSDVTFFPEARALVEEHERSLAGEKSGSLD